LQALRPVRRGVERGALGGYHALMIKKLYNYPAHAVRVFERVVQEQAALGRSLRSLGKGYLLGSGVSLWFDFADTPATAEQKLTYFYGGRREESDAVFHGWRVSTVLPMRAFWITIGYFYVLQRDQQHAA
jgi:hypothetical protein